MPWNYIHWYHHMFCRYASVSIFLNQVDEGGELVFPLADNNFSVSMCVTDVIISYQIVSFIN